MMLLVDVGNSRLKWNTALGDRLQSETQSFAWHIDQFEQQLRQVWHDLTGISTVWVSNVAGEAVAKTIDAHCAKQWGISTHYAHTKQNQCGVRNAYADPQHLGVDRWLALLAAQQRFPYNPVCIIDCGTAITVDWMTAEGEHLGGAIAPGVGLMQQALLNRSHAIESALQTEAASTDKIPEGATDEKVQELNRYTGKSTQQCMSIGTLYASVGFVRTMIENTQQMLSEDCKIIITGGDAARLLQAVSRYTSLSIISEPDLVLNGLLVYGEQAE